MSNARFSIIQSRAISDERIDSDDVRLLGAYGIFSDKDGWCWPSQETIAEMLPGKTRQWVNVHTSTLVALGYMEKQPRFGEDGGQLSNKYRILFDTPPVKKQEELLTPPVTKQEGIDYTNAPLNAPFNTNTETGKNQPVPSLPIEWQLLSGKAITELPDQKNAQMHDAANLLVMGTKMDNPTAYGVAYAFMKARDIVIPNDDIKANRKPLKKMVEMGVQPHHIEEAVQKMVKENLTCVDLFSVAKIAIDLANPVKSKQATSMEFRE